MNACTKFLSVAAVSTLSLLLAAQDSPASGQNPAAAGPMVNAGLPAGVTFAALLDSALDSKKGQTGDPVTAHMTQNVKMGTEVVLPSGAKLVGHVTQISVRSPATGHSSIGIAWDRAVLANNQEIPLQVSLQAVAEVERSASSEKSNGQPPGPTTVPSRGNGSGDGPSSPVAGLPNVASAGLSPADVTPVAHPSVELTSSSHGVLGLKGLSLETAGSPAIALITSTAKSVRLDRGTRLLIVTQSVVPTAPAGP